MSFISSVKILSALAFALLLAGCKEDPDEFSPDREASVSVKSITVTDYTGAQVSLDRPAGRIVALSPHIVENLFAVGAGSKIVAAVSFSDFPEQAKSIPRLGGYSNFSLESVISFRPDLVIGWPTGDQNFTVMRQKLEALGVSVYADEPGRLEDIAKSLRDFGLLADTVEQANAVANDFIDQLNAIRREHANRARVELFYQIWNQPLQTLNGEHIVNDIIELCGGKNLFAQSNVLAPTVNIEAIIKLDPRVIIVSSDDQSGEEWLREWRAWPGMRAVKSNALFTVPSDWLSRHTTRMIEGAEAICRHLDVVRSQTQIPG